MIRRPAVCCGVDAELDAALRGELESIREQVLEHLLQPLGIGDDRAIEVRRHLNLEVEATVFRLVPKWSRHGLEQVGEKDFFCVYRDCARFNLRQIENVGDEVEKIGTRAVNRACELDLPFG